MTGVTFSTAMFQDGNNTGIEVPEDAVEQLGAGKRAAVIVDVNGYQYRSTIAPMGGRYLIPFSAARRDESGIKGGDAVTVTLTADDAPRTVEVPDDLKAALDGSPAALAAWDALSYSRRKEHVRSVVDAKKPETRARRVASVVDNLG